MGKAHLRAFFGMTSPTVTHLVRHDAYSCYYTRWSIRERHLFAIIQLIGLQKKRGSWRIFELAGGSGDRTEAYMEQTGQALPPVRSGGASRDQCFFISRWSASDWACRAFRLPCPLRSALACSSEAFSFRSDGWLPFPMVISPFRLKSADGYMAA